MKAETAVTALKGLRERAETYDGLVQASGRDLIALAFAHSVTKDALYLIIATYLTQGIVRIPIPFLLKIREGYKTLEKLPSTKEFKFDLSTLKSNVVAATAADTKAEPKAQSFDKHLNTVESEFDKFFKTKETKPDEPDTPAI